MTTLSNPNSPHCRAAKAGTFSSIHLGGDAHAAFGSYLRPVDTPR